MKDWWALISWTNLGLVASVVVTLIILWRWQTDARNTYNLRDLLVDHTTGKASVDKHIVLGFAVLSSWVVVSRQLAGKEVETLLLGVLGIFILQRAASKALDTFAPPKTDGARPEGGDSAPRRMERK